MSRMRTLALLCFAIVLHAVGQTNSAGAHYPLADKALDPGRSGISAQRESAIHQPLPEDYIWTKEDAVDPRSNRGRSNRQQDLEEHYFRGHFSMTGPPAVATLYLAGPRKATVYINGEKVCEFDANLDRPIGIRVFSADVSHALKAGQNVIAIEAVRGPNVGNGATSRQALQLAEGKVLVVKILPAGKGVNSGSIEISNGQWKASMTAAEGWESASFDDSEWENADNLGAIESSIEFFQWNADAGMYDWPGYDGISPFLEQYKLDPVTVSHVYGGTGEIANAQALMNGGSGEFTVSAANDGTPSPSVPPQILLDFGREVVGRVELDSDADEPANVTVQYGESEEEALRDPYLGINPLYIPSRATVYGPKSAFRYALVRFTGGKDIRFRSIRLAGIEYPVEYKGSFDSSDPQLNRMWTVGAYTAHLCMQDDIWDAPKRDRGRWMGDLDVSGRTIEDVFGDRFLMEETLDRLIGPAPVTTHVNGIAGYSAFWVTGEKEYYLHSGSRQQLESVHGRLVQLLQFMETELDDRHLFANKTHAWPFVDWSPELNGDDPLARMGTQFEYNAAFRDGVYLLRQLHDTENADKFEKVAEQMKAASQEYLAGSSGSFGTRWQTNAYAVLSDTAKPDQYESIWTNALASVGHVKYNALIVSPYYNYYVISAMAELGHRADALNWIRQYWGGMIDEGATSFWEGYDPSWYKRDFHASLQADNTSGYRISLAHGWSSGVTPWIMEQILGIHPRAPGFAEVDIRPDLIDLAWARGGEPTPHGNLGVDIKKAGGKGYNVVLDLPGNVEAHVSMPVSQAGEAVRVNGKSEAGESVENGSRTIVTLKGAGNYVLETH